MDSVKTTSLDEIESLNASQLKKLEDDIELHRAKMVKHVNSTADEMIVSLKERYTKVNKKLTCLRSELSRLGESEPELAERLNKQIELLKLEVTESIFKPNMINLEENCFGRLKLSNELKLLTCSFDKTIKIWDLKSGFCIKSFDEHENSINCIELISNEIVASGSYDQTIKLWNLYTGECYTTLKGHTSYILSLKLLRNNLLASGSGKSKLVF